MIYDLIVKLKRALLGVPEPTGFNPETNDFLPEGWASAQVDYGGAAADAVMDEPRFAKGMHGELIPNLWNKKRQGGASICDLRRRRKR